MPTPKVTWEEPSAFRRAVARQAGLSHNYWKSLGITTTLSLVAFGFSIYHQNFIGSWQITLVVCLGIAFVIGFCIPYFLQFAPCKMVVSPKGVTQNVMQGGGTSQTHWPWEKISHITDETISIEQQEFEVIRVHLLSGGVEDFALHPQIDRERLAQAIPDSRRKK